MDYKETSLWKNSIGNVSYGNDDLRKNLEEEYIKTRENAKYVLEKIRHDFPELTIHNINHTDALWRVGSIIAGKEYKINPLEGFVLGCAFLTHDAVLSYYAVGGVDNLRETIEWKDFYEDFRKDETKSADEQLHETDFKTLRFLHAKYAEKIYDQKFKRDDGSEFFIIDDEFLRRHLGETIGKISASHHLDYDDMRQLDIKIPPTSDFPTEWSINPIKLACILRCADAGHLDDGRAPDNIYRLLDIKGISRNHWTAQNRLSQIDVDETDESKVIICSNISFKEEDFEAWNVAYEAVQILNKELKLANDLLRENSIDEFGAKGVKGSESRESLSKYIKTEGWIPCDAQIHISNVEELIKNLGGEKLYGKDHKLEIALRELLQNARDAIVARRKLDSRFIGKIHITVRKEDKETWIDVCDDGVGMSIITIKDYLLNFGSSFWKSDLVNKEFTGLKSSGFKSIGEFGIGFFTIFLVSKKVLVKTKKYNQSEDDARLVKFPSGLTLNPIITKPAEMGSISTEISFCVEDGIWHEEFDVNPGVYGEEPFKVPFSAILANLVAGLDVDVYYKELNKDEHCVHKNIENITIESNDLLDWLKDVTFSRYRADQSYSEYIENNYKRVRKIIVNGRLCGMAALNTFWSPHASFFDVTTVGGLSTLSHSAHNGEYLGYITGEADTAKRDSIGNQIEKKEWANEQYNMLLKCGITEIDKLCLPYIVGKYDIDMSDKMLVPIIDKKLLKALYPLDSLVLYLAETKKKLVFLLSNLSKGHRLENHIDYEKTLAKLSDDELLFQVVNSTDFLNFYEDDKTFPWNIRRCLDTISEKMGFKNEYILVDNKGVAVLTGNCKAYVLMVTRNNG